MPPPEESLHAIHDFEIDINVELDSNSNHENLDGGGLHRSASTPGVGLLLKNGEASSSSHNTANKQSRRFLNLQEYKRRRGLI